MYNPRKKVLVIDDDQDILEIISIVLDTAGCEVLTVNNGRNVDALIKAFSPDIILLDVLIGDMDGRDICQSLKNSPDTSALPIIIVSATHGWHDRNEENCHADYYISKPFDIVDLSKQVLRFA